MLYLIMHVAYSIQHPETLLMPLPPYLNFTYNMTAGLSFRFITPLLACL
jgi:hypothetical protein